MSAIRHFLVAIAAATLFTCPMPPALAILIPIGSAARIPFSERYPEDLRKQVRTALQSEGCKFIDGVSTMAVSWLRFEGDTTSVNQQLQKLADCPSATVAVSFERSDQPRDWKVRYEAKSLTFRVIINLDSERIRLEELVIPPANSPASGP